MSVIKTKEGKFLVDVNRKGVQRVRKLFTDKDAAFEYEKSYLEKFKVGAESPNADNRRLSELIVLWDKYHGINLADRAKRVRRLHLLSAELGSPIAANVTPEMLVNWRFDKLNEGMNPKTINNVRGYLNAMYHKLFKLKVIAYPNPVAGVDAIKLQEKRKGYLSKAQIDTLMTALKQCVNQSTWYVAQLCLRTGARWGEVEGLRFKQLHNGLVTFEKTKSKKLRTIPLAEGFYQQLLSFLGAKNPDERCFTNCIGAFRRALKRSGIILDAGQCSHILRHTYASYFMMNGGNIVELKDILGHSDIKMTMVYAHLAPGHLQNAAKLGPIE